MPKLLATEVTRPRGERERDGVLGRLLQLCYIVQRTTLLLPSDPLKVRRRSSDLWKDPEKRPLKSNGQMQEDKENVQVAPHVPADGEEPTNVKSIRCQCSVEQSSALFCTTEFIPLN